MSTDPQVWMAAFITLGIYSFLLSENPIQKVGEYLIVGLGMAHSIIMAYQNVQSMAWAPLTGGKYIMIIPLALGLLMWSRWFKSISYFSRPSLALLVGVSGAVALRGALSADLFGQVLATIRLPLATQPANWIIVLGVIGTITHFMYILPGLGDKPGQSNPVGAVMRFIGVYVGQSTIMAALGAAFAFTIMGRVSVVIGRLQFLFRDWIYLIRP